MNLTHIIIILACAIIAWFVTDYFSPHPVLTMIVKVVIFVAVLIKVVLPLLGMA